MEVTVNHLGSVQFEIKARQHSIVCDQPPENGGFDEGMTPPELMLASLASCAGFYAAQYLKKFKLATEGTKVRVTAEKLKEPPRLGIFTIEVDAPVELMELRGPVAGQSRIDGNHHPAFLFEAEILILQPL